MGGCLCSAGAGGSNNQKKNQSNPPAAAAAAAAANVISVNGDLHRYAVPVTVSQVLLMEMENPTPTTTTTTTATAAPSSSSSSSSSSSTWTPKFFMCNSDRLYYDDYIQALDAEDQLEANQIYFVLPPSRLQYQLTSSDMAALAVKASLALLHNTNTNTTSSSSSSSNFKASFLRPHLCCCRRRHNKTSQISPVLFVQVNNNNKEACFSESDHYKPPKGSQSQSQSQQQGGDGDGDGVWRSGSVKRRLQRYSSRRVQMAVRSFRIRLTTIYEGSVLQFS